MGPGSGGLVGLGVCKGITIYALSKGWNWKFGVLVGQGDKKYGGSPINEKYAPEMDPYLVRRACVGTAWVVHPRDFEWAFCQKNDFAGHDIPDPGQWRQVLRKLLGAELTASYIGVILRSAVQARPSRAFSLAVL